MGPRVMPVSEPPTINMSPPSPVDHPMENTSPTNTSGTSQGHESDPNGKPSNGRTNISSPPDHGSASNSGNMPAPPPAAAAAVHQPKIVQTAFIHKLYK